MGEGAQLRAELARLDAEAIELKQELQRVKDDVSGLQSALQQRRAEVDRVKGNLTGAALVQRNIEEEESSVRVSLKRQLEQLRQEKEKLMQQVEREEEFLCNQLQRDLSRARQEKLALQKHLRAEERYIGERLRKQLQHAQEQTAKLERQVAEAQAAVGQTGGEVRIRHLIATTNAYKVAIGDKIDECESVPPEPCDSDAESSVSAASESVQSSRHGTNPGRPQVRRSHASRDSMIKQLEVEISRLHKMRHDKEEEATAYQGKCAELRRELEHLSQDNFLKEVRALRLREELERTSEERNKLFVSSEYLTEHEVTTGLRMRAGQRRGSCPAQHGYMRSAAADPAGPHRRGGGRRPSTDRTSIRAQTLNILMRSPAFSPELSPVHSSESGSRGHVTTPRTCGPPLCAPPSPASPLSSQRSGSAAGRPPSVGRRPAAAAAEGMHRSPPPTWYAQQYRPAAAATGRPPPLHVDCGTPPATPQSRSVEPSTPPPPPSFSTPTQLSAAGPAGPN